MVIDNEKLIKYVKPYMILSGTWKMVLTNTTLAKNLYYWYSRGFQGIFVIFLSLLFTKLIQLFLIKADLQAIISNMAILVSSLAVWMKIFIYQKNNVPQMFEEIKNEERNHMLSLDNDIILLYNKNTKFCKKLILGIILNVIFAMGSMFIVSLANYLLTDKTITKSEKEMLQESFMYPFWLPYKENENMVSVIILNVLFAFVGIILFSVSHMIFATLLVFATTQFEILHVKIGKLTWNNPDDNSIGHYNLKAIVIKHSYLIKFMENLNRSTMYVVFVDFLLNSLNVASVAIQVITLQTSSQIIFPLAYLVILVMQVFALGWLANEVKVKSLATADALYQTDWYNLDNKSRKMLHIMLIRSQKPLIISTGPFGAMTTETALATMQAAYSYITLMQNYK